MAIEIGDVSKWPPSYQERFREGWTLLEDNPEAGETDLSKLETFNLPEEASSWSLEQKKAWVKEQGCTSGQRHADYVLAHVGELPDDCYFVRLVCPGTIWSDPKGNLYVPFVRNFDAFPSYIVPEEPEVIVPALQLGFLRIGQDNSRLFAYLKSRAEGAIPSSS